MPKSKKKWLPANWNVTGFASGYTGGYPANLKDWPGPVVRLHPHPGIHKRRVYAKITSWVGISPGAEHFYVDIHEEPNAVWWGFPEPGCEKGHWVQLSKDQDPEGQGKKFYLEFTDEDEARAWRRRTLRKEFSRKTHFFIGEDCDTFKGQQWQYKEGD